MLKTDSVWFGVTYREDQPYVEQELRRLHEAGVYPPRLWNTKGGKNMKETIATSAAPAAIGPYAQGASGAGIVITSGQLGLDPETGAFAGGIEAQTRRSLENVKAVLEAGGSSMDLVLKTTVFLKDMGDFAAMNAVYAQYFPEGSYPARSAVQVARLPKDGLVEIEAIALKK